jgi:hypothetical protein
LTVDTETLTFEDTEHRRRLRFELLNIQHPETKQLIDELQEAKTAEEIQALIAKTDEATIGESDLSEILFALGPDGIGMMLKGALQSATTDEDVAYAAQLSAARHGLLESLQNFSS